MSGCCKSFFLPRLTIARTCTGLVALSDALRVRAPQLGLQLPIRAVVAGGVVAVVKFGARTNTHDVDFALNAGQIDLENLIQRVADEVSEAPHPTDGVQEHNLFKYWFNPAMSYYLNGPAYQGAYTEALQQGEVLFRSDALELYIAPWKFQLYRKMGRVTKALWQTKERRLTDIEDTVDLIHQFNTRRKQPLTLNELRGWYQDPSTKLDHQVAQEAARIVSERYRAKYGGNFRL